MTLMSDELLLTMLWLLPLIGAAVVLSLPRRAKGAIKWTALAFTGMTFLLTLSAYWSYVGEGSKASAPLIDRIKSNVLEAAEKGGEATSVKETGAGLNDLVARRPWIPSFQIEYFIGLDGISLGLVMLNGLVSLLACAASWKINHKVRGYFALVLLLVSTTMGVFLALDLFLFYIFFEVMLLPMYFLIGLWGGEHREYAAIKFLLYTLFGSVFILIAILILFFWTGDTAVKGFNAHTFDLVRLTQITTETGYYGRSIQGTVFLLFLVGFLIKLPSFPFHTWLPDAHVEAPTPISMILAGILLKVGGYGLLRMAWPLAPAGAYDWSAWVAVLGVVSILYGALVAMAQTDFKKLVAYSSVSHMGYVTLGLAVIPMLPDSDPRFYDFGVNGAIFMMIAHGITSAAMFFIVGVVYEPTGTRDLTKLGGLLNAMPLCGAFSFVIFFGTMGLPGLCGFIGEVFVIIATFNVSATLAVFAAFAMVLTAGYVLWTIQRVFLGKSEPSEAILPDLNPREIAILAPLVILTVALGVIPQFMVFRWAGPSLDRTAAAVARAKTLAAPEPAEVAVDAARTVPPRVGLR